MKQFFVQIFVTHGFRSIYSVLDVPEMEWNETKKGFSFNSNKNNNIIIIIGSDQQLHLLNAAIPLTSMQYVVYL